MNELTWQTAAARLKRVLQTATPDTERGSIIAARDEVLAQFGPIFSASHAPMIEGHEVLDFLNFRNNRHWTGLHRMARIVDDIEMFRSALERLLNEDTPVAERIDDPKVQRINGLGKAILTAMLHVAYPEQYGVWNRTSEDGLVRLGLFPNFPRGTSMGEKYAEINEVLLRLSRDVGADLWSLDALFWGVQDMTENDLGDSEDAVRDSGPGVSGQAGHRFGLEKHLQNFMADNWESLEFGPDWFLYEEDKEIVGVEFDTREIGRIDLLARHRTEDRWLVIELKRAQSSDQTVGQVLRYMGWVKGNLAAKNAQVEGLIVARDHDSAIAYALKYTTDVGLRRYRVNFELVEE
ncbi:MAG: endonuclease NucS domain-containing protein [Planctomycetota bacterium]